MSALEIPLATHYLTASVLSLVIPLGTLVAVAVWYLAIWQRRSREER